MTKRFDTLQAGRGIAALLVVLFHSQVATQVAHPGSRLSWIFDGGRSGVDFFFVLSGFLMMFLHARDFDQPARIGAYLKKRVTRIYPLYWLVCAVLIPAAIFAPALMKSSGRVSGGLIAEWLLLLPHTGMRLMGGVTWTLEYEVTFYAAFLLFFVSKRLGTAMFALWGAGILGALAFAPPVVDASGVYTALPFALGFLLNLHCIEFLLGILVAVAVRRGVTAPRPSALLGVCATAWVGFMTYDATTGLLQRNLRLAIAGYALLTVAVLFCAVVAEEQERLRVPRWLTRLGAASYSIYLTHFLAIMVARVALTKVGALQRIPAGVFLLVLVPAVMVPGFVLHYVAERPLMAWLQRRRGLPVDAAEPVPELLKDRQAA